MMDEQELSLALHGLVDRDGPSTPPVQRLLHRGHLSRRMRSIAGAATATVTAGLLVAGFAGFPPAGTPPTDGLVYAGAHATPGSYHFRTTDRQVSDTGQVVNEYSVEGDSDPGNQRAVLKLYGPGMSLSCYTTLLPDATPEPGGEPMCTGYTQPPGAPNNLMQEVGGVCYFSSYAPSLQTGIWAAAPGACFWRIGAGLDGAVEAALPMRPGEFRVRLQALGSLTYSGRAGTGAQAVETWSFRNTAPPLRQEPAITYTGTITINAATGLVTRLWSHGEGTLSSGHKFALESDTTFSRYGTPVVTWLPSRSTGTSPAPSTPVPGQGSPTPDPSGGPASAGPPSGSAEPRIGASRYAGG
jgi:hypothetical protein